MPLIQQRCAPCFIMKNTNTRQLPRSNAWPQKAASCQHSARSSPPSNLLKEEYGNKVSRSSSSSWCCRHSYGWLSCATGLLLQHVQVPNDCTGRQHRSAHWRPDAYAAPDASTRRPEVLLPSLCPVEERANA